MNYPAISHRPVMNHRAKLGSRIDPAWLGSPQIDLRACVWQVLVDGLPGLRDLLDVFHAGEVFEMHILSPQGCFFMAGGGKDDAIRQGQFVIERYERR